MRCSKQNQLCPGFQTVGNELVKHCNAYRLPFENRLDYSIARYLLCNVVMAFVASLHASSARQFLEGTTSMRNAECYDKNADADRSILSDISHLLYLRSVHMFPFLLLSNQAEKSLTCDLPQLETNEGNTLRYSTRCRSCRVSEAQSPSCILQYNDGLKPANAGT